MRRCFSVARANRARANGNRRARRRSYGCAEVGDPRRHGDGDARRHRRRASHRHRWTRQLPAEQRAAGHVQVEGGAHRLQDRDRGRRQPPGRHGEPRDHRPRAGRRLRNGQRRIGNLAPQHLGRERRQRDVARANPQPAGRSAKRRAPAQPAARRALHSDQQPGDGRSAIWIRGRRARRPAERHARRHRRQRPADGDGVHLGDPDDAGSAAGIPRQHVELQCRDGPLERPAGIARHAQRHESVRRLGLLDLPPHGDVDQRVLPGVVAEAGGPTEQTTKAR